MLTDNATVCSLSKSIEDWLESLQKSEKTYSGQVREDDNTWHQDSGYKGEY